VVHFAPEFSYFQNNIQQNKDWNKDENANCKTAVGFQNNIQQNKDWNLITNSLQSSQKKLSE